MAGLKGDLLLWFPDSLVITRSDFTTKNNSVDEGVSLPLFCRTFIGSLRHQILDLPSLGRV